MLPLHRNQSIDFYFKSVDWFQYERDIAMKKAKSKNIALKWQLKVNVSFGAVFRTDNTLEIFLKKYLIVGFSS